MEASALAFGVSSEASNLKTALQNARAAKSDKDLAVALDSADEALERINQLTTLAFNQAANE